MFTFYEVGGKVRDELLGLKSKDIDYVAVPDEELIHFNYTAEFLFVILEEYLKAEGYELFLVTSDCFTIRARFPKNNIHYGLVADFVMSRKEIGYVEGTRTPIVVPGTLYDDLMRRDFTVNAIAKAEDGTYIDPFGGQQDIKDRILRTPIASEITFNDDPLRLLRAIRFMVTKDFNLHRDVSKTIHRFDYENKMKVVSEERIREELHKCFKYDTIRMLSILCSVRALSEYVFTQTKLWLKPTNES